MENTNYINNKKHISFYILAVTNVLLATWFFGLLIALFVFKYMVIKEIIFLALGIFLNFTLIKILSDKFADAD